MSFNIRTTAALLALSLLLPAARDAAAQDEPRDRFQLSLGAFLASMRTDGRIDIEGENNGGSIDFEEDFDLSNDVTDLRLEGHFRFNKRHRLFFSAFALDRDRSKTLERDWQVADVTFKAGSSAKLSADYSVFAVGYRWDAVSREKYEFGLSIAASMLTVGVEFSGEGTVDDGTGPVPFAGKREASVTAPVPLLGVHFDFFPHEKWQVRSSAQYLSVDVGDFEGSMLQLDARVDYFPIRRFGLGLGLSHSSVEVETFEEQGLDGALEAQYSGFYGYLTYRH